MGAQHGAARIVGLLTAGLVLAQAAACSAPAPARAVRPAVLVRDWGAAQAPRLGRPGASLADLAAYWRVDLGVWSVAPGRWRRVGDMGPRPPGGRWSWSAAALAARASGFGWPSGGAVLYRAPVVLTGSPAWTERPSAVTLWAAVRRGSVAAGWLTFTLGARTVVTVFDQGPAVFTLPYWSAPAPLRPAQRAALPSGTFATASQAVAGGPPGALGVTLAAGMAAFEALLVPGPGAGAWRYVPLGPAGSALAGPPALRWGDATGRGGTDVTVYFGPGGTAQGLAIYGLSAAAGGWRATPLFAGDGDLAAEVAAPGRAGIVVLGLWDLSPRGARGTSYQTVVWRDGGFRLGPGIEGPPPPVPPSAAAPGPGKAVSALAPDVLGMSLARALRRIAGRSLGALPVVPVLAAGPPGVVLWQDPPPGTAVGPARALRLGVSASTALLGRARPPALSALLVRDAAGSRSAGPAALRAWSGEMAWLLGGPSALMRIMRGPGEMNGATGGRLLVATLARPWRLALPAAAGAGLRAERIDTLAFSDRPLYDGWLLLGSGGQWVAAARLSAPRDRVLRSLLERLAP